MYTNIGLEEILVTIIWVYDHHQKIMSYNGIKKMMYSAITSDLDVVKKMPYSADSLFYVG